MRYLKPMTRGVALSLLLAVAPSVYAQDASLFSPSAALINYNPFSGFAGLEDVILEVTYTGDELQTARLIIRPDIAPDLRLEGAGEPLLFEINTPQGQSNFNELEILVDLKPSDTPQQIRVTFKIPSGQYADAGDLDIDLKVALYDSATSELISNEDILTLVVRTPLRAQTNFAGTSAGYNNGSSFALVDFGEIMAGDSRTVNFQIRGNSDVDIAMQSENDGRMISLNAPNSSYISYTVNADGIESSLSTPLEFTRRPEKSLAGSNYPLRITLDNSKQNLFSGQYRDIISIDVTPR